MRSSSSPARRPAARPTSGRAPVSRRQTLLIRAAALTGVVVLALAIGVGIDIWILADRITHVSVAFPAADEGQTWLLVGTDQRSAVPGGANVYGSTAQAPGTHADAVLLIHVDRGRTSVLSVPRDVLVSPRVGVVERLTMTLGDGGAQSLVDGMCRTLHVPVTHLVMIDMRAFAGAVDDLGGVTVTVAAPVRDSYSGLDLPRAGRVHLDGLQALALARSRHPQYLIDGRWQSVNPTLGDQHRTTSIGAVFAALAREVDDTDDPFTLQELAGDLTGGVTTDQGTGIWTLADLDLPLTGPQDVPVSDVGPNGVGAVAGPSTMRALAAAGYQNGCTAADP